MEAQGYDTGNPEIMSKKLEPTDEFVVLACDGIFFSALYRHGIVLIIMFRHLGCRQFEKSRQLCAGTDSGENPTGQDLRAIMRPLHCTQHRDGRARV